MASRVNGDGALSNQKRRYKPSAVAFYMLFHWLM